MYFFYLGAFLSTFFWIDILFAEYITAKVNPYSGNTEIDQKRSKVKTVLVAIMALFWSAIFTYS